MVVGFNHNFRYKGEVYHIQTEDSGLKSPNIVTLLYYGGTILASRKTSYADITRVDKLEQVVEELMKEQHKNMLRSLKLGEFDDVIDRFHSGRSVPTRELSAETVAPPSAASRPVVTEVPTTAPPIIPPVPPSPVPPVRSQAKPAPSSAPVKESLPGSTVEVSLDEVILSYLMGDEK